MSVLSKILARVMKAPAATHRVKIERDLPIALPDGVTLLAHRYVPVGVENPPLVLVRSPYGRAGIFGTFAGEMFAERGLQVVVVSVRGTFGSGGTLRPFAQEKVDGLAVLQWLREKPWYPGAFGTHGPSYLGNVQWAIATEAGPELKGMALQVTASEFQNQTYPNGSFAFENALAWADLISTQEGSLLSVLLHTAFSRRLERGLMHLPLNQADQVGVGKTVDFFQDWLVHDAPGDPWWAPANHQPTVGEVTAPIHMTTGWYDLFLPWQLRDYQALKAAGRAPRLVIGPWSHADPAGIGAGLREAIPWLTERLRGDSPAPGGANIFVGGADQWRELPGFPPASTPARFHLHEGRRLSEAAPTSSPPDTYRYDPADPTPSVGGPLLQAKTSGPRDNRPLEARADVLSYTSEVLSAPLEIIGTPEVELFVQSSLEHTDFFVRLCDVHPNGRSMNICDGLTRVKPGDRLADGSLHLRFSLWATAHRFAAGHRVRVQVSSGAHPRYARNLGSGEPLATGTTLVVADQTVFHEPTRNSAVILPVVSV